MPKRASRHHCIRVSRSFGLSCPTAPDRRNNDIRVDTISLFIFFTGKINIFFSRIFIEEINPKGLIGITTGETGGSCDDAHSPFGCIKIRGHFFVMRYKYANDKSFILKLLP
jgi:hypothetical protein